MRKVRHRQPAYSKILLSVRRAPENARGPHCLQQLQHGQQRLCKVLQALRQQAVSRLHRQNLPKVQSHGKRRRLHLRKVRFRVLFDIFATEEDLASHTRVEDYLFVPAILALEKQL